MTDEQLAELRQRNERRAAKARAALGTRWLCHPANRVQRKPVDFKAAKAAIERKADVQRQARKAL